jgi:hypothetical protein
VRTLAMVGISSERVGERMNTKSCAWSVAYRVGFISITLYSFLRPSRISYPKRLLYVLNLAIGGLCIQALAHSSHGRMFVLACALQGRLIVNTLQCRSNNAASFYASSLCFVSMGAVFLFLFGLPKAGARTGPNTTRSI